MHDVIILGSGIAGLFTALQLAEAGRDILILTKKKAAVSATNFAQGGIAAVMSAADSFEKHVQDTLTAGCRHNLSRTVRYVVSHGPRAIEHLLQFGVPFAQQGGNLSLTREGGHSERRIAYVSDYTGLAIEKVLVRAVRSHARITLVEHAFALDVVMQGRRAVGVKIVRDGSLTIYYARAIVLATGGAGRVYSHTTNPPISTGDGIAMALRAGAATRDLEFMQFHPTAFTPRTKPLFLISEAVRGEGAFLRSARGERFMVDLHPLAELAPRDIVSRAIFQEMRTGPVYLDIRHKAKKDLSTRFSQIYRMLALHGINMERDLIPVAPAAHYLCGGVRVDLRGRTNVPGLYCVGEVSATGLHGANRLASNSLLEAVVFAQAVAKDILEHPRMQHPLRSRPAGKEKHLSSAQRGELKALRGAAARIMWEQVGIVRTAQGLKSASEQLSELAQSVSKFPLQNCYSAETRNVIDVACAITAAALKRTKSLGCHFVGAT